MKNHLNLLVVFIGCICLLSSCDVRDKKTTISVVNPDRHYFPLLQGQILEIIYPIENTGVHPLIITDMQTSCGCILINNSSSKMLPAGKKGFIRLTYDSKKNIGYVKHYVTIFGNIESGDKQELIFDLNVVPDALYTKDYEELYKEEKSKYLDDKTMVDGAENERRYYTDLKSK